MRRSQSVGKSAFDRETPPWLQEVDLAITADLGSLQRLPHLIGYGDSSRQMASALRNQQQQESPHVWFYALWNSYPNPLRLVNSPANEAPP